MPQPSVSRELMQEAVDALELCGGYMPASRQLRIPYSTLRNRVRAAELAGVQAKTARAANDARAIISDDKARFSTEIRDGIVIVASDAHYWPGEPTTAHRALVRFCQTFKPHMVVMNGDVFDGAQAGRWPRQRWQKLPTVREELDAVRDRLSEIEAAAPGALKAWPLGNHDARFETRLSNELPQYEGVPGFTLKDHFPAWTPCWGVWINGGETVIKHRWKGGIHATYQNTLQSGVTLVTGHLHSLAVRPFTDYTGTRYGVDTGTLAEPRGAQFEYTEDGPKNWRSGFVVLTFWEGKLLQPELVQVLDEGLVDWRGGVVEV